MDTQVEKARLVEIKWDAKQKRADPVPGGKTLVVQFNPQSLRLSFANQNKGGDQPGGAAKQFVGSSTSRMSVELLFDTTDSGKDVRKMTEQVAFFIGAKPQQESQSKRVPPGLSFEWGTFIFRGVVDSMEETLDYFSEEGVPMRATVSMTVSRQDIEFLFGQPAARGGAGPASPGAPVSSPLQPAKPGDSLQQLAGRSGQSANWRAIADANGIDDPLRLRPGALLNLNVNVQFKASIGTG